MGNEELTQAIKEAEEIAKHGTMQEKADFVEWVSAAIRWNSAQFNEEAREANKAVEAQYKAYLNALNK